jgi:hypothetical protein
VKETCWTLSNIAAGTDPQVLAVINAGVVRKAVQLVQTEEYDIGKEAAWLLSNITSAGVYDHVMHLLDNDVLRSFATLLERYQDARIITVGLEGIEGILRTTKEHNDESHKRVLQIIEEYGMLDSLEKLQVRYTVDLTS